MVGVVDFRAMMMLVMDAGLMVKGHLFGLPNGKEGSKYDSR